MMFMWLWYLYEHDPIVSQVSPNTTQIPLPLWAEWGPWPIPALTTCCQASGMEMWEGVEDIVLLWGTWGAAGPKEVKVQTCGY